MENWRQRIWRRMSKLARHGDKCIATPVVDPLNRRASNAQLRSLSADFFFRREKVLSRIMEKVAADGGFTPSHIEHSLLASLDERVVEYPLTLAALLTLKATKQRRLLDVGCVLNNKIISNYVQEHAASTWFWNASLEKPVYSRDFAYVISDLRNPFLPEEMRFDLVTCLSTLEHTGMDNTRYGGQPAEFQGKITDPERYAIEGLQNIMRYVAPGGRLLVSVPYGPFEFLYQYGLPDRPIYYTFDQERLIKLASVLDCFDVTLSAYRVVTGRGWVPAGLDEDQQMLRHADGCASAGGVAFIEAVRH